MAREASRIILKYPNYLRDYELVKRAHENAIWVKSPKDRKRALKEPGVIVSPAGMLKGGAALYYLQKIYKDKRNAIFLVSYQIPGTPGRYLLDTHCFKFEGREERVKAEVYWFDFSSHCGDRQLREFLSKLSPETKVFLIHGEEESIAKFVESMKQTSELEIMIPKMGECYEV